jgi:GR25 family glycosyltransferase involved in LPS biosynthesis
MIIKKFVINLDRRPDRLEGFYTRYGAEDVERFSAFDGKYFNGSHAILDALIRRHPGSETTPGMFGCWMSHLGLWEKLISSNEDAFLIFEDDAFFTDEFMNKLNFVLNNIDNEMSLVYFGGRFRPNFKPADENNWMKYKNFWQPKKLILGKDLDRTTHGYVITKNGAKKALELYSYSVYLPRGITAIDGWLNENRLNLCSLDIFPHVCYSPMNYQSDIQAIKK